jgi:ArsR family transcriptional regulator
MEKFKEKINYAERIFKALASSRRLEILSLVLEKEDICAKEIAGELGLSQPDISYHLSKLRNADILGKEKEGTRHCYHLNEPALRSVGIEPKLLVNEEGGE